MFRNQRVWKAVISYRYVGGIILVFLLSACAFNDEVEKAPQEWNRFRHERLGFEIDYPATWKVDETTFFVHFYGPNNESFGIVKATDAQTPDDFVGSLGAGLRGSIELSMPLTVDGRSGVFLQFSDPDNVNSIRNVVFMTLPHGQSITLDNRTDEAIFLSALRSMRFFEPINPP